MDLIVCNDDYFTDSLKIDANGRTAYVVGDTSLDADRLLLSTRFLSQRNDG